MNEINYIKKYNSIDLVKFLMAFAVVAIHTCPLINCESELATTIYSNVVSLAVPFFFLASGYLISKKMKYPFTVLDISIIEKHLQKIVKLYIMWMIIYTPLAVYKFSVDGTGLLKSILLYIRGLLFIGEQYNSWPLWYLLSTIYSLLFIIFFIKIKVFSKQMLAISLVFFVMSIGISWFVSIDKSLPLTLIIFQKLIKVSIANGRILSGMIYIPLGMLIAHKRKSTAFYFTLMITGYAGNCLMDSSMISEFILIITAVGLFGTVANIELKDSIVYPVLRSMSTSIYFIHMYIWTIYYKIVYGKKTFGWDSFLVTTIIAVVSSYIYFVISKNQREKDKRGRTIN